MPKPIQLLFIKSGIANRPGLALQNVSDKAGHQTKRWKRTAQDVKAPKPVKGPDAQAKPAGKAPDLQPGHRVKFQAGEHQGQGEVTAVGKDGVTVKDASGREHGVHHHELTHHAPAKGEAQAKPEPKAEQTEPKAESQGSAAPPDEHVTAIAKAAADPAKYAELPKAAKQPSADPDELYQKAEEGLQQLKKWLNMGKGVASQMGYQTMTKGPDKVTDEEWDKPGGMLFIAGLKARDGRAAEKVQKDYKGDWSQLADIVRCTLAADNLNDLSDAIKTLESHGMKVAKQPKNKFLTPTGQGYRDMNFVVTLPNGMLAEVQFNVKDMLKAKNVAHHFYEETRSINGKYNEQGIGDPDHADFDKWSQEDLDAYNQANDKQVEIYTKAWVDHVKKHYGSDKAMVKSILLLWRLK